MNLHRSIEESIREAQKYYQVITITGPRQSGKTTLCRLLFDNYEYVNLEDASTRELLQVDIKKYLLQYKCGLIIDEVQRIPEILSYIQVIVDSAPDASFILTGSSNFALLESITQSLAGRSAIFNLLPFTFSELGDNTISTDEQIINGFYPGRWQKGIPPQLFYSNYYATYVERDIRQIIKIKNFDTFQRFIKLLAGRVGTESNNSRLANEVGVSSVTINEWISILEASYIIFKLPPFFSNINKRITKSSKIYFYDTGLLCYLLRIESIDQLSIHPIYGSIFENMIVADALKKRLHEGKQSNLYFYRDSQQKEVDLIMESSSGLSLFEIKSSSTYHPDFMKNIDYVTKLFKDKIVRSAVLYSGHEELPSKTKAVLNYEKFLKE